MSREGSTPISISLVDHSLPNPALNGPYPCSPIEAQYYYYGIDSQPKFIARSSSDLWLVPQGPEAYLDPKECAPVGVHRLSDVWESSVGDAMEAYLQDMGVRCTSMDPLRIGKVGESSPPVIVWIGVIPGSLTSDVGIQVAVRCRAFITDFDINDVHVEIRESEVTRSAKLYKPVVTSNPIAQAIEPFSTALGLPICNADTPDIQGTAALFFTDPAKPSRLFLLTARHVVIDPDKDNNHYAYTKSNQPKKEVLLLGDAAFKKSIEAIKSEIGGHQIIIEQFERRLGNAEEMEVEEDASMERVKVHSLIENAKKAIEALNKVLVELNRDFKEHEQRVLGHVVLSPPIGLRDEGYTEDWAVIEVDPSKVNKDNFRGNFIDLGTSIPVSTLTGWMHPNPNKPSSFEYPGSRLLKLRGTLSDDDMLLKPDPKTVVHENNPTIMVLKRGCTSGLTVGRLNTIRSFVRHTFEGQGKMSKEVAVFPRDSRSGPFSKGGDSGSIVINGTGQVAGLLTGGAGITDISDCSYVTSIQFLLKRLAEHGIKANILPTNDNL